LSTVTFKIIQGLRREDSNLGLQDALLFYCTLYTDCPGGRNDAVARYVSFAQIACFATSIGITKPHSPCGCTKVNKCQC